MFRMLKSKSWFGQTTTTPKNVHSPEYLKYLYSVLSKNSVVSESNKSLLVETLRSIAEILIWGDQNDSTVFDFFLEKNMLSYFLKIMKQKCGSYVCVQLLQTLNILFENIRNETSLYYLLSNNHVNSIIEHKFDFSDEEVMAYYISFLKTLSFKLNSHTIHFFYNEHTNDFPLYTEAIKFFNNSESMVRIAVRTLTLNVYRVDDKSMLKFIRDKTAAPYFSNLVWFIGNNVQDIDAKIRTIQLVNVDRQSSSRLEDLVAEHLDHLHYVNDILLLGIDDLNEVLTDHLLNRLFIPIHLSPFTPNKDLSLVLGLFLLSQVFVIVTNEGLLRMLRDNLVKYETAIVEAIDCAENDYVTLYALTLINGLSRTLGKDERPFPDIKRKIIQVVQASVKFDTKVRLVTLSLACGMLLDATEQELSLVDSCREENVNNLLNYFKTEEMFLEIFEDEFNSMKSYDLDHLLRDSVLLLPPVGSPLSFVHIDKRRPCGEGERCRRSLRVYFVLRSLSLRLRGETEKKLPLMQGHPSVQLEQNLDLTNSDLLAVTVIPPVGQKYRRFLVVDSFQLILVDPSQKRMGWGIAKFVGFLQELEVVGDSSDSRCLHVTVKGLSAKFMFDDHIRCMAARQRLLKGRAKARERKLAVIGRLLNDLTNQVPENLNCRKKKYLPGAVQPFST